MNQPPKNQAEWLLYLADLAERHMLTMITKEGTFLQLSFIELLRAAGRNGTSTVDLQADLLTLLPRFCNSILQAEHGGEICRTCGAQFAGQIFNEILQDLRLHAERKQGGLN